MPVLPEVGSTIVPPGSSLPFVLERRDHRDADPVLDAGQRVEELELEEEVGLDPGFGDEPLDAHQRRVADGLDDAVVDPAAPGRIEAQPGAPGVGVVGRIR